MNRIEFNSMRLALQKNKNNPKLIKRNTFLTLDIEYQNFTINDIIMSQLEGKNISWKRISSKYRLNDDFILYFKDKLFWNDVLYISTLSYKTIDKLSIFFTKNDLWKTLFYYQQVDRGLIEKYKDYYDIETWKVILNFQYNLNETLLCDKFFYFKENNLLDIVLRNYVSEKFLNEYVSYFDDKIMLNVINYQTLTEKFIENNYSKFENLLGELFCNFQMSEAFLEKHKCDYDKSIWQIIANNQKISKRFLYTNYDKLSTFTEEIVNISKINAITFIKYDIIYFIRRIIKYDTKNT